MTAKKATTTASRKSPRAADRAATAAAAVAEPVNGAHPKVLGRRFATAARQGTTATAATGRRLLLRWPRQAGMLAAGTGAAVVGTVVLMRRRAARKARWWRR